MLETGFKTAIKYTFGSWSDSMNNLIGKKVTKLSGKPFKSHQLINTIKGVIQHPVLKDEKAFTFLEDDSYVSANMCKLID